MKQLLLTCLSLCALSAGACNTAELGPKPVWAGGDAPSIGESPSDVAVDTDAAPSTPDTSVDGSTDAVAELVDGEVTTVSDGGSDATSEGDGATSVDAPQGGGGDGDSGSVPATDTSETSSSADGATETPDADGAAETLDAGGAGPGPDAGASEDAATPDGAAGSDADIAALDTSACDPGSDPTCAGAMAPAWQLEDVAVASAGFSETYGLNAFLGEVTVLALLTGG